MKSLEITHTGSVVGLLIAAALTSTALTVRTAEAQVAADGSQKTKKHISLMHMPVNQSHNDDASIASVTFTNVTAEAGITFVNHGNGSNHAGVAAVDLTGDGYPELFFQDDGTAGNNHFYVNNGDGTFTEAAESWGLRTPEFTVSPVFFDYNNDGLLDLALTSRVSNTQQRVRLLLNMGGCFFDISDGVGLNERFGNGDSIILKGITAFDYNGDGLTDIFVTENAPCNDLGSAGIAYQNNPDGTFTRIRPCTLESTGCNQWEAVATDLNLDNLLDVFCAEDFNTESHIFLNDGAGTLMDVGVSSGIVGNAPDMGVAVGDYDNDGDFDVYTTDITSHGTGGNRLFQNQLLDTGSLSFVDVARDAGVNDTAVGWGATFFDYDNDGWLDLAVASGNAQSKIFHNNGDGTFDDVGAAMGFDPVGNGHGIISLDYDLDGDLDLIVTYVDGPALLYRNDGGNANHAIKVLLHDTTGRDPQAIGSKITVIAGDSEQIREVYSGYSFNSQEPFPVHFGLAQSPVADTIIVEWTDGTITTTHDVDADQTVTLLRSIADMDLNAQVNTIDFIAFLNAWAGGQMAADMNSDGVIDSTDFGLYLAAFLADR